MPAGADAVIHVATTGHDTAGCGRVADPCQTIPYAYGRAADGDTIQVAAGTYTLAGPLRIARPGFRRLDAVAGVTASTGTGGRPGKAPAIIAGLKHVPTDALLAGPFLAPINAFSRTTRGHVSLAVILTPAGLDAPNHRSSGQPRPQMICVRAGEQTACLHFAVHPEVSLHVTKTAAANPAHAGRPVTFIITITNPGPAAFGLAGAGGVHLDLRRHRPAEHGISRVRQRIGQHRARPQHRAHHPAGTTGHGCTPTCRASVTITRAPIVPVTG